VLKQSKINDLLFQFQYFTSPILILSNYLFCFYICLYKDNVEA